MNSAFQLGILVPVVLVLFSAGTAGAQDTSMIDDWTLCAPEGGVCAFTGPMEVRYGANGSFVYRTSTDGTPCSNAVFGDPIVGTVKACSFRIPTDPTEWTFCAAEGDQCPFSSTREVRYGANGVYVYQTLTDGTACTNAVFGDPLYGTVKACAIRILPDQPEWTFCAVEGGVCAFTGTREVRYGANGVYVYQTLANGTGCTNAVFGDPLYGVVKNCDFRTVSGSILGPEGGIISAADGRVILNAPAGAVSAPITITINPVTSYPEPERVVAGTVFDFGPDGTDFATPVQLSIRYDVGNLPLGAATDELRVHRLMNDTWVQTPGSTVDAMKNTVTVDLLAWAHTAWPLHSPKIAMAP